MPSRREKSASRIEEATTFKIQQPGGDKPDRPKTQNDWLQGYGYQFWRCQHGAFRGDGAFGQFTIVLPGQDAVIVMTGENKSMQGELSGGRPKGKITSRLSAMSPKPKDARADLKGRMTA